MTAMADPRHSPATAASTANFGEELYREYSTHGPATPPSDLRQIARGTAAPQAAYDAVDQLIKQLGMSWIDSDQQ